MVTDLIPAEGGSDARLIMHAEGKKRLRFKLAQNDSADIPFRERVMEISEKSIAGYVALTRETVMLDDAYVLPKGVPYTFNRSFDEAANYRTRSVLAVPMQTQQGSVVGVLAPPPRPGVSAALLALADARAATVVERAAPGIRRALARGTRRGVAAGVGAAALAILAAEDRCGTEATPTTTSSAEMRSSCLTGALR